MGHTQRNTDVGALINPGASSGAALFREADTHSCGSTYRCPNPTLPPRAWYQRRNCIFAEHPNQSFPASIVRTANALDPALRTLQVELQVDNAAANCFPGAYAEVHFKLSGKTSDALRVPINALLFRAQGMQVATVGADNHVEAPLHNAGRRLWHFTGSGLGSGRAAEHHHQSARLSGGWRSGARRTAAAECEQFRRRIRRGQVSDP